MLENDGPDADHLLRNAVGKEGKRSLSTPRKVLQPDWNWKWVDQNDRKLRHGRGGDEEQGLRAFQTLSFSEYSGATSNRIRPSLVIFVLRAW